MGKKRPRLTFSRTGRIAAFTRTLAVLALAIQCLVVQTHVHAFSTQQSAASAAAAQVLVAAPRDRGAVGHNATGACLICQATATTRTSLASPNIALPLLERTAVLVSLQTVAERAPAVPAHTWHSRGPPTQA